MWLFIPDGIEVFHHSIMLVKGACDKQYHCRNKQYHCALLPGSLSWYYPLCYCRTPTYYIIGVFTGTGINKADEKLNAFGRTTLILIIQGSRLWNSSFRFEKADVNTKYMQLYGNGVWTFRNEINRINDTSPDVTIQVWNFQCIIGHFPKEWNYSTLRSHLCPRPILSVFLFFNFLFISLLCEPVTGWFPPQRDSNADSVSILWRHNGNLYELMSILLILKRKVTVCVTFCN